MNFEEPREQKARRAGHVCPRAAFELGEVGLTELPVQLLAYCPGHFRLRHLASEPAGESFEGAQSNQLVAEPHCNLQCIAESNIRQEAD